MGRGVGGEGEPSSGASHHLLPEGEGIHPRHAEMAPHIRTTHAVRLGFRQIIGVKEKDMLELTDRRGEAYDSVRDLWLRSGLSSTVLERLADADAFRSLGLDRRQALSAAAWPRSGRRPGRSALIRQSTGTRNGARRAIAADAAWRACGGGLSALSLSLKAHPASFLRIRLSARGILRSEALPAVKNGERVTVAGLVLVRQRPGTAAASSS